MDDRWLKNLVIMLSLKDMRWDLTIKLSLLNIESVNKDIGKKFNEFLIWEYQQIKNKKNL